MNLIDGFHHEAIKLPNGNYLVLADSEQILTDVQGSGPVDIIGDTILVLDSNLQVMWSWDAFNYMDPHRMAILGETCTYPTGWPARPFTSHQRQMTGCMETRCSGRRTAISYIQRVTRIGF